MIDKPSSKLAIKFATTQNTNISANASNAIC